jgi:hypothetical protein
MIFKKLMFLLIMLVIYACGEHKQEFSDEVKLDSITSDSFNQAREKAADTILYLVYHPNIPSKRVKRPVFGEMNSEERVSKYKFSKALYVFYSYYGGYYLRFEQSDSLSIISFDSLQKLKVRTIEKIEQEIEPLRMQDDSLMRTNEWLKSNVVGGIPFLLPTMRYFNNFKQNYILEVDSVKKKAIIIPVKNISDREIM